MEQGDIEQVNPGNTQQIQMSIIVNFCSSEKLGGLAGTEAQTSNTYQKELHILHSSTILQCNYPNLMYLYN